jgi:large subunit ribosomal protein L3
MTQIFAADGTSVPVTVVAIEPNTVTKLRTPERDGYSAVQVGIEAGKRRLNKPDLGQFKGELPACAVTREFRVDSVEGMTLGQTLDVSLFAEGDLVDVTGVSKGKGFAGTIKRHSFSASPARSVRARRRGVCTGVRAWRVTWVSIASPSRR